LYFSPSQTATISRANDVPKTLAGIGAWGKAVYHLGRDGVDIPATVFHS